MTASCASPEYSKHETIHASCVAWKNQGIILLGKSGSGKSDLALRLIDRGARLVSDDQVIVKKQSGVLYASPPENLRGMLEVYGLGIFRVETIQDTVLKLAVSLCERNAIERLPYPECYECLGIAIPHIPISPLDISAALKIEMAIAALEDSSMMVGALCL